MSSILLIIFYILYFLLLAFHLLFLVFILYPLSCLSYLLLLSVFLDLLWMFYLLSSILIFDHLISFLHGCFPSHILYLPTPSTLYPPSCMVVHACSSFIFCLLSSLSHCISYLLSFRFYLLSSVYFVSSMFCLSSSIFSRFSSSFCLLRHFTHLVCAYLIYYVFHLLSSTPTIHLLFYILYLLSFFGLLSSSLYLAASLSYFLSYILCLCMFSIFFFLSSAFYRLSADQPGPAQLSQSAHAIAHFLILLSSSKADVRRTILSTSPSSDKSDVQQTVYSASPASQPSPSSLDRQLTHSLLDVMVFREKM